MKYRIILVVSTAFFLACGNPAHEEKKVVDPIGSAAPAVRKEDNLTQQDSIKATASQILIFLKEKNYPELSKYFSSAGVRFSPYGYIDTAKSKKLTPSNFLESIQKNWVLTWGQADGSGAPIKLTVEAYLKRFVYNADYRHSDEVGYDELIKQGNAVVNLKETYPNHHFIDYHFEGFDQKLAGMDWTSLRLVFEKRDGQYFLVAMIHDQWTV